MIVVEILRSLCLTFGGILRGKLLVEEVARDVVYIDEFYARLLYHLAIPLAIGVIASLNLAIRPLVTGCEGE